MTAENTNDFTIIHGSEFGLPCNLKCGPGLRPHGTICFENRRKNTDDYDSSHELCISVKQKPELRVAEGQGVLKQESLDRILKFVSDNRDTIKDYLGGFTTAKGFLRALRKEHELKEKIINWKRLVFVQYDIPLYVPNGTRDAYLAASPWNKFKEIVEIEKTDEDEITIKDIGKTTWCSEYDLDFTNVDGIKAYIAIGYDDIDKTVWLARVMKVPAGTGLLLKGNAGTYKIPHANVRSTYVNYLKGNLGDQIKIEETDGDKTNYYLSGKDGTFVSVNGSANIGKNKAYLQLPTSVFGGTRSIGISYDDEDGTTSIKNLTPALSEGEGAWYTLQGQRVAKPGKGVYIKNGKKVVIK